jgi:tyrosine-protein phosphatase YwqE
MIFGKRYGIAEAGLLRGMADIHSHLLFGVDDGALTEEKSLAALYYLEQQGLRKMYLTPHVSETFPENSTQSLKRHFKELTGKYSGSIELRLSAEYMLDCRFKAHLEDHPLLIAEDSLLVETSCISPPVNFSETVKKIKSRGYRIILAHPERYGYMDKTDCRKLNGDTFISFQLNILSLTGYYGEQVRKNAEYLLDNGFYTFAGTDIHNLESHKQAFNRKSLSIRQINRINILLENNQQLF